MDQKKFFEDRYAFVEREFLAAPEGSTREKIFTKMVLDDLSNGNSPAVRGYEQEVFGYGNMKTQSKINAYFIDDIEKSITLYVTLYKGNSSPEYSSQLEVTATFKKLYSFTKRMINESAELLSNIVEEHPLYSLIYEFANHRTEYNEIIFVLLTDTLVREIKLPVFRINDMHISLMLFDMERYRRFSEGQDISEINVNMDILGSPLSCVYQKDNNESFDIYCCMMPGEVLYRLYDTYHYQVLNSNVRTYLQLRGNVNKGIMETIKSAPDYFLAYNNGISATASTVVLDENDRIISIGDFQIVNGGQTSASIYNAKAQKGYSIDKIWVQTKITVIKKEEDRSTVVKNISRYANTQNTVKFSDFSANDSYNKTLAALSQRIYTPQIDNLLQTKWYYENISGNYNNNKSDLGRPFIREYPEKQKFTKTDMAAYELSYQGLPADACKGAQDAYKVFVLNMSNLSDPTEDDFKRLVAKKILFDSILDIISSEIGGQGKKAMACYVLAYFSQIICEYKFNLDKVWENQTINSETKIDLSKLVLQMCNWLRKNASDAQKSVEMYCRQRTTWEKIKKEHFKVNNISKYIGNIELKPVLSNKVISEGLAKALNSFSDSDWIEIKRRYECIDKENKTTHAKMCGSMITANVVELTERQICYAWSLIYRLYKDGYQFTELQTRVIDEFVNELQIVTKKIKSCSKNKYFS